MTVQCSHWRFIGSARRGLCTNVAAIADHGERPETSTCIGACMHYDGPARGLGDRVHAAVQVATGGIVGRGCAGCRRRRRALNAAYPSKQGTSHA